MLIDGGANFQYADTVNEEPNAALFCKDDLTINGTGNLTVNTGFNNGIGTKDDMLVVSGNITVNTANHGLRGNDSVTVVDGNISITAGNDGINISGGNDTNGDGRFGSDKFSAANGERWLKIIGGTITVTAGRDGIDINGSGEMTGGNVSVTAATLGEGNTIDSDGEFTRTGGNLTESGGNFMGGGKGARGMGGSGGQK